MDWFVLYAVLVSIAAGYAIGTKWTEYRMSGEIRGLVQQLAATYGTIRDKDEKLMVYRRMAVGGKDQCLGLARQPARGTARDQGTVSTPVVEIGVWEAAS